MSPLQPEWIRGVSAPLPVGERIRWQGAPAEGSLARHAFHVRKIAAYFGLLLAWRAVDATLATGAGESYFLAGAIPLVLFGALAVGCSLCLAHLTHRTAIYAVTDRRVVMRTGLVLTSTINIPFRQIEAASVRRYADGTGDIALQLGEECRLAYLLLWPHARAWRLSRPQPTLRAVPQVAEVAELLRQAALSSGGSSPANVPPAMAPSAPGATADEEVEALV